MRFITNRYNLLFTKSDTTESGIASSDEAQAVISASENAEAVNTQSSEAVDNTDKESMNSKSNIVITDSGLTTSSEVTQSGISVGFKPSNFVTNLKFMGKGMLGIFVAIAIIIIVTYIIAKLGKGKR